MDWLFIFLTILVVASIGWLWFVAIKDITQRIRNSNSSKINNRADDNNCNNDPKPSSMGLVKYPNCINYQETKTYKKTNAKGGNCSFHRPINIAITFRHLMRIIKYKRRG